MECSHSSQELSQNTKTSASNTKPNTSYTWQLSSNTNISSKANSWETVISITLIEESTEVTNTKGSQSFTLFTKKVT